MSQILKYVFMPLLCMLMLSAPCMTTPVFADSSSESEDNQKRISDWFEVYDEIRRDAEMTTGEKLKYGNSLKKSLKSGEKLSESTKEFAEKMREKYEAAAAATKKLSEIPETKELQEGYSQYFSDMEHSFAEMTKPDVAEVSAQTKAETKAKLEKLTAENKALDARLRAKYGIAKHKHR